MHVPWAIMDYFHCYATFCAFLTDKPTIGLEMGKFCVSNRMKSKKVKHWAGKICSWFSSLALFGPSLIWGGALLATISFHCCSSTVANLTSLSRLTTRKHNKHAHSSTLPNPNPVWHQNAVVVLKLLWCKDEMWWGQVDTAGKEFWGLVSHQVNTHTWFSQQC